MPLLKTHLITYARRGFRYGILLSLLVITLVILLSGCAGRKVTVRGMGYLSPEAALTALAASDPGSQAMTVTARIEINARNERHFLKAALMMRKPAHLRLESIPLLGPPDFYLSIDADEIRVFLPEKRVFYADRATERNLSRFFPLSLSAAEMVSLLMGRLPVSEERASTRRGEWEDGLYRIDQYRAGEKRLSLWIDPEEDLLHRIWMFTEKGDIAYAAEFADHTRAGKGFLPQRLTITREGVSLTVRYTDILPDSDGEPFALPVPEGITPLPFD